MKNEIHRLGDYIREVNVKNKDLKVTNLLGLSMSKQFRPSTSNIVGVDLSNYKVVRNNVFAFDPMSVIRVHKVPIALNDTDFPIIVSPAYITFECIDVEKLDPKYLMMWFQRTEFDRYADFKSDAAVRGGYDWKELCETLIIIPSIEQQREIVSEYETISKRIKLNQQIIKNLEATAQTLYHKMFVEGIDKENLPEGWRIGTLGEYVELSQGIQVEIEEQSYVKYKGYNRFIRIIDYTPNSNEPPRFVDINNARYYSTKEDVVMIRYGDAGTVCRRLEGIIANNLFKITPIKSLTRNYIYAFLRSDAIQKQIRGSAASSTMPAITHTAIKELKCIVPINDIIMKHNDMVDVIEKLIILHLEELKILTEFKSLLLAKMGR